MGAFNGQSKEKIATKLMLEWSNGAGNKTTPTVFNFSIFSMISTYVLDENICHI